MTWFRVGGAGIPAPLKNAMNAVLNKKFGTSGQNYPPKQWPDEVNLMGPLPEGTASGPIANITDGADGVPIKNWLVTLPASLSGYTAIHGTKNTGTGTPETQYTASLGRTIYGGTADIVTGEGEDGYGYVDLGTFTWVKVTNNVEKPYFSTTSALNPAYKYLNSNPNVKCSNYSYGSIGSTGTANGFYVIASSYVRIRDDATENMTADEFKTFITGTILVYELATPTPFTFTPITAETALGVNNFWADEGDSDVTYRADIDLVLNALQGSRSLSASLMRSESPEEVSEPEENIQNTEEQEGENDER